jgi:hypothetical protein
MTEEHIPQRSVGNDKAVTAYTQPPNPGDEPAGFWTGGHTRPTLCTGCNKRPSDWGYIAEYKAWHGLFHRRGLELASALARDPFESEALFEITLPYDRMPGRFVRQVIGNLLACQQSEWLITAQPQLAAVIGPDPDRPERPHPALDVSPVRLYMGVANKNWILPYGPAMLVTTHLAGVTPGGITIPSGVALTTWTVSAVVTPFVFVLADGPLDGLGGFGIDSWTKLNVHARLPKSQLNLRVPTLNSWTSPVAAALGGSAVQLVPNRRR